MKFCIDQQITVNTSTIIEAASEEEAKAKAKMFVEDVLVNNREWEPGDFAGVFKTEFARCVIRCSICDRQLDDPNDPTTRNCGGDCLRCMADAGDPDAKTALALKDLSETEYMEGVSHRLSTEPEDTNDDT